MRKILLGALFLAGTAGSAMAAEAIKYNYFELGYNYLDLSGSNHADGFYVDGAFDLSRHFYLGGYYSDLSPNRGRGGLDRYGAKLGFHTGLTGITDFYSELKLGQFESRFDDSFSYGAFVGTRTTFNPHFELITKAGYTEVDKANDGYFEAGVKGLFKISRAHAFTAEFESLDGDLGANVGFRFMF
ncbi:hypothetical protein [Marinicella gelatinilytica]|uniref:hypothetical protein n=1 Tax=Marinicella gelatinilytica TaxID=2996017 RepID=UPI002260BC7A|nr:hypothetical protein [Marinicella gelatinilytica]MCX7543883.1 hypothetical protein [Marinicella gelatinilytica]